MINDAVMFCCFLRTLQISDYLPFDILRSDIPLDKQKRWFKDSFDHLLAIAQSQHAPEAGVIMSSG